MKKYLFTVIAIVGSLCSFAQIPNPDFESWTTTNTVIPAGWKTAGTITKVTPATEGTSAIRIERSVNSIGAILYGDPPQGGGNFTGGVPFADRPDSLVANFKYDVPVGDSAWILVMFKTAGVFISQDFYFLTGSNTSSFLRKSFAINYAVGLTPDSLVIAFLSGDPNKNFAGGFLIMDDVHFTNTSVPVPNGGFESWLTFPDDEPDGWYSPNQSYINNTTLPVTKTTDKYSGNFAARMENIITPGGIGMGYLLAGPQAQSGLNPGFPVSERNSALKGYYKFYPQNHDSLTIGVIMFSSGVEVGWGFLQDSSTVNTYTLFNIPINFDGTFAGTPDSATILLLPFTGGSNPHGNSVLYVDNLSLTPALPVNVTELKANQISISNFPNPCSNYTLINYSIPENDVVHIKMYDMTGREVAVLFNGDQTAGTHGFRYDSSNLGNGIYQLVIETNNYKQNRKIVVQK